MHKNSSLSIYFNKQELAGCIRTHAPKVGTPRCGVTTRAERAELEFSRVFPHLPLRR
jgi:hypothetical protein